MTHVIVHAGFHKTGTTSLQQCLRAHRKLLMPHAALYFGARLGPVQHRGRHYGYTPTDEMLGKFRRGLRRFLRDVPAADQIVLSREAFCGALLGETRTDGGRVTCYHPTSVPLARELVRGLRDRFGDDVRLTFVYSTRDNDSMIASAHRHLLRLRRMTDDLDAFAASLDFDTASELDALRAALGDVPLVEAPLAKYGPTPAGPATAILDLLALPDALRTGITWDTRNRPGQSAGLSEELLHLNRSIADDATLAETKRKLLLEREGIRPD